MNRLDEHVLETLEIMIQRWGQAFTADVIFSEMKPAFRHGGRKAVIASLCRLQAEGKVRRSQFKNGTTFWRSNG